MGNTLKERHVVRNEASELPINRFPVILNVNAGQFVNQTEATACRRVEAAFDRHGLHCRIFAAQGDRIPAAVTDAFRFPGEFVYVVGGDGTVQACLADFLDHDKVLGIVPAGTLNLLARDLEIPVNLDAAIASLSRAPVRRIDVGEVNDALFACSSMLGMMPLMALDREFIRGASWSARIRGWTRAISRGWWRYPILRGVIRHSGGTRPFVGRSLAVSANPFSPAPGRPLARSSLVTGHLALYLPRSRTRLATLRLALQLANAPWEPEPSLVHLERCGIEVDIDHASKCLVMNDGELHRMDVPMRYRLHARRLRVLAPKNGAAFE